MQKCFNPWVRVPLMKKPVVENLVTGPLLTQGFLLFVSTVGRADSNPVSLLSDVILLSCCHPPNHTELYSDKAYKLEKFIRVIIKDHFLFGKIQH
jgi:hypothetical protein